jgi:putative DNA methylase
MPEAPGPIGSALGLAPFALRDAPALIERVFPAQKVGVEAQKERKSGAGQTLTALGSYWKGRKPLVLVRACILAALLPATDDAAGDLALLEALLAMDERGLGRRQPKVTPAHIVAKLPDNAGWMRHIEPKPTAGATADEADDETDEAGDGEEGMPATARRWRWRKLKLSHIRKPAERRLERARIMAEREALKARAFAVMSFAEKVFICKRPEEIEAIRDAADPLYANVLADANARLGTTAQTLPELVRQLGIARFGHAPVVGDPFAGGGSIPFEAARLGCGVVASDLNPVAVMLTWGALNIIGAARETRTRIAEEQRRVARAVDAEVTRLGIEHDAHGNRAKAFLYCVEVVDPQTGWRVPLAPSWVVSRNRRTVARIMPDYARKRFDILIEDGTSAAAL